MRADELLMQLSIINYRKQIKPLIREKRIKVDGQFLLAQNQNIDPGIQEVTVDGVKLTQTIHRYIMLNKPLKTICANSDDKYTVVMDLLKKEYNTDNLYTIGRLDFLTTGLLLISDNGPLGIAMLHPENHVTKSYLVTTKEPLDLNDVDKFKAGIIIDGKTLTKPAKLEILNSNQAKVIISEGKYRQIRKMFLSVGKKVDKLHRVSFGEFHLDEGLDFGEYRTLNSQELLLLKKYF